MMREVIGAIMAAVMGLYLLWYILPMLYTQYDFVKQSVNQTDPTIQTMLQLGDGVYLMLPLLVILIVGFLVMSYATRREPFDI